MNRRFLAGLLTLTLFSPAGAQHPPVPPHGPAPLLHARLSGPQGMHVTFYQGQAPASEYAAPAAAGLRPGYVYRVRLSNMADFPGVSLYPSIEVRGSLELPCKCHAADYPAPLTFTANDIRRALEGVLITKVIYLEHPERAAPVAAQPGQALEADLPPHRDLLEEARLLGRPVAIVRLGQRVLSAEELSAASIPGTILLPGAKVLGAPARPPCLPWGCVRVCDPILGCRPSEEECLHDGGDVGLPVGIRPDGRLGGLDPTDTVAEYTDSHGRRAVTKSNRICICVPRFAILRSETPLAGYNMAINLVSTAVVHGGAELRMRLPSEQTLQVNPLVALVGRERPSGTQNTIGLVELGNATAIAAIGRIEGVTVIGGIKTPVHHGPDKPLVLCKWASAECAQIGDIVTFYLKYSNYGAQPITNIAVNDSLTTRLEYIPGTARSDRDAVFTTQANEAGSLILRWEIGGKLLPGTSGVVSFQARVR
jgi:uncharacterized repeat protein (TIGR01451 family)